MRTASPASSGRRTHGPLVVARCHRPDESCESPARRGKGRPRPQCGCLSKRAVVQPPMQKPPSLIDDSPSPPMNPIDTGLEDLPGQVESVPDLNCKLGGTPGGFARCDAVKCEQAGGRCAMKKGGGTCAKGGIAKAWLRRECGGCACHLVG